MKPVLSPDANLKPLIPSNRDEDILKAIYKYRYMSARDLCHLLYSPKSLTHVREILHLLSGGDDYVDGQFLYRFPIPTSTKGTKARAYTLGAKGRDVLSID